jgi:hypothetical protein
MRGSSRAHDDCNVIRLFAGHHTDPQLAHPWCAAGSRGASRLALLREINVQIIISHRFEVDRIDRLFYALLPLVGYLLGLIAAVLLVMQTAVSVNLIAAAVLTLLLAAIRNAWDMMVWMVIKTPSGGMPPP